jgi:hypothetical protein
MKSKVAMLCLGLASAGFSMDEYLPIAPKTFEVDLGYAFVKPTGIFDNDAERRSWEDLGAPDDYSPILHGLNLQLKYGIAPGLDVEFAVPFVTSNDDADVAGVDRPELGLKYANPGMKGAGVYGNVALPLAQGDFDAPGNGLAVELGGVYQNRFGDFRMTGRAGYEINFEYEEGKSGNTFGLLLKPEAMWTEFIGTYLGVNLSFFGEDEFNGFAFDNGGYDLTLAPGLNVQLLEKLAYEIAVPVSVAGKNTTAAWGVVAQLYITLP